MKTIIPKSIIFLLAMTFVFSLVSCCEVFKIGCSEPPNSPPTPIVPEPHPDFWISGCYYLFNGSSNPISIFNAENQGYTLVVGEKGMNNFKGVNLPWCNNSSEIETKAFRFHQGKNPNKGPFLFYLFQNYSDNKIYYSKDGLWTNKVLCASKAEGRVNVLITCEKTPWASPY